MTDPVCRPHRKRAQIGMAGYARIVRALIDEPCTVLRLQERVTLGHTAAYRIVQALHQRLHLVRIAGWHQAPYHRPLPIYAFGEGPDAPAPRLTTKGKPARFRQPAPKNDPAPPNLLAFVNLLRALDEPRSAIELAELAGIDYVTARRAIKVLRSLGLVRIARYEAAVNGTGMQVRLYAFAIDARDANKPAPIGRKEVNRRYAAARRQREAQLHITHALAANASIFAHRA